MTDYIKIPLDPTGEPGVVDGMKAKFIGEFSVMKMVDDEEGDEHLCALIIPWTTCKDIYKSMAKFAADSIKLSDAPDQACQCKEPANIETTKGDFCLKCLKLLGR